MKVSAGTISRTICLIIALINQLLAVMGKEVLPFLEDDIYQLTSLACTMVTAGMAWWKNNSFTKEAILGDSLKDDAKRIKEMRKCG